MGAPRAVDPVFGTPAQHSPLEVLIAVYGYAVQIYCDLSAIHRDGHRSGPAAQLPVSGQLRPPVRGGQPAGLLAALAHDVVALAGAADGPGVADLLFFPTGGAATPTPT
jgi:hypothetical protein